MTEIGHRAAIGRELLRVFGPRWVAYRAGYALQQRSGLLQRRWPPAKWEDEPLGAALSDASLADPDRYLDYRRHAPTTFFFGPVDRSAFAPILRQWDVETEGPRTAADAALRGTFRYFTAHTCDRGFPPDWHLNPFTQQRTPKGVHWSRIGDYEHGDIKILWELSRFGFTYDLVRAYWRTGDERYVEAFWRLVEDWRFHNPPHHGANWKCGQETSFRVMAWCFGLHGFLEADATTPQRVVMLTQMLAFSGQRIERNLRYALSQRNNHGISEATGLWTIGLLFPELRRAARWRALGAKHLEELGCDLIYDDGAFVQHSTNYHRLMLHAYLWSIRLGDLNSRPFTSRLRSRVSQAGTFLYQIQDELTGEAPFYGHNDGALILPLDNCGYHDMRPVVQATSFLCEGKRRYDGGPWDEDLLWLFGPEALGAPRSEDRRTDVVAPQGGISTLRSQAGFASIRCPSFLDRPSQADALHVDLWWRGQNMALDGGTFSYNAAPPWDAVFARTASHNTVTVDDLDQMDRVGRFLWLPWLTSRVRAQTRSAGGDIAYWEGEHNGYARLPDPIVHRRAVIRLPDERWLILDALEGGHHHSYRLHWLLPDLPVTWDAMRGSVCLDTPSGPYQIHLGSSGLDRDISLVRASTDDARGWMSRYYLERTPALSVALRAQGGSVRFWSVLGPPCTVTMPDDTRLRIEYEGTRADIRRSKLGDPYLVSSIETWGHRRDQLEF
jgi:hypothetical protein